jgi:deoxycytidine triphosphate deaminase
MKIEYLDDTNFIIYLNKYYIKDLNLDDKKNIEEYFKKMFVNLKNNYGLDIYGYYDIRVYVNHLYGLIIDVFKLSSEYYKLYSNKVDMKIIIDPNNTFLYEIDDYFIIDKVNLS